MANNFASDPNCKAVWNFNNGAAPNEDSVSTNDLSNGAAYPTRTVSGPLEGEASMDFEASNSEYLYCNDADLSSGFPLKNGDSNKVISIVAKMKAESVGENVIFGKYDTTDNKRSISLSLLFISGIKLVLRLGYNSGASNQRIDHTTSLSTGTAYCVFATYRDDTKAYVFGVRTLAGTTIGSDVSGTATNNINVEDSRITVGAISAGADGSAFFDGLIDEVAIFSDIITADEATQIAQGTYGAVSVPLFVHQYRRRRV